MSVTRSTSLSLVERVRANEPHAWQRFVQLYSPLVYYWCRQQGLQPADSADILQNVLQSFFTGIGNFRSDHPDSSFRGWLWTIARNKLRDYFNRKRREPPALGDIQLDE